MYHLRRVSKLIFYFDDLSIGVTRVLRSPTIIVLLSISPFMSIQFRSVQFSHSVVSNSLQHHVLKHTRSPHPSLTPRVYPNSCPLSQWCHPTILSSVVPFVHLLPSIFPTIRVFSNESALCIRWPKYWSFSFNISPSVNTQDWSLGWTGWIP